MDEPVIDKVGPGSAALLIEAPVGEITAVARRWLAVGALTVVAAAAGGFQLGTRSLWFDESWSVLVAQMHGGQFWRAWLHADPNMSLYYLLLHFWVPIGASEAAVRALSLLWTVATVPVLYALSRRLLGFTVAWVACLLFGTSGFVVTYAQQARGYSLLAFLAV